MEGAEMKKIVLAALVFGLCLSGCFLFEGEDHDIELYVSLGSASTLPPDAGYNTLNDYWGKTVRFSAMGLDAGINNDIVLQGSATMNWTGNDPASGTQYASFTFTLENWDGDYPAGRFRFKIYIDWNDSDTIESGDVMMGSYSIIADKDGDPDTQGEAVAPAEYGTDIVYNAAPDYSISIDDPLATGSGFQWRVESIHEGDLTILP
jgi:hypothetical protein